MAMKQIGQIDDLELIKNILDKHDELDLERDQDGVVIEKSLTKHIINRGKIIYNGPLQMRPEVKASGYKGFGKKS